MEFAGCFGIKTCQIGDHGRRDHPVIRNSDEVEPAFERIEVRVWQDGAPLGFVKIGIATPNAPLGKSGCWRWFGGTKEPGGKVSL